jgi:hypothetical protein
VLLKHTRCFASGNAVRLCTASNHISQLTATPATAATFPVSVLRTITATCASGTGHLAITWAPPEDLCKAFSRAVDNHGLIVFAWKLSVQFTEGFGIDDAERVCVRTSATISESSVTMRFLDSGRTPSREHP